MSPDRSSRSCFTGATSRTPRVTLTERSHNDWCLAPTSSSWAAEKLPQIFDTDPASRPHGLRPSISLLTMLMRSSTDAVATVDGSSLLIAVMSPAFASASSSSCDLRVQTGLVQGSRWTGICSDGSCRNLATAAFPAEVVNACTDAAEYGPAGASRSCDDSPSSARTLAERWLRSG